MIRTEGLTRHYARFSAIVLASLGVDRLTRARIDRQARALEFQG